MQTVHDKIIELLEQNQVRYKHSEHEPVRTSLEAAKLRGTDISHGAKSLVFMADEKPVLLVLSGNKRVDTNKAKKILDAKDLRMATADEVLAITTVEVGGVPPFGNVMGLQTYVDEPFTNVGVMDCNVGDKAKSVEMSVEDYLKIVKPTVVAISET